MHYQMPSAPSFYICIYYKIKYYIAQQTKWTQLPVILTFI